MTWSESGGTPFLFFGSGEPCAARDRRERLYDMSDPASPREVGDADYWSFSYRPEEAPLPTGTSAGFNHVAARMAKLWGDHLYRAAYGFLDVHRLRPSQGPAVAGVSASPESGTVNDAVEFTATGLGGSPPLVYAWEVLDGTGGLGLPSAPLLVEIPSPGSLQVLEFEAQNCDFLSCTPSPWIQISTGCARTACSAPERILTIGA